MLIKDKEKCKDKRENESDEITSCCVCKDNKIFNSLTGECDNCPIGCLECDQSNVCTKCDSNDLKVNTNGVGCVCKQKSHFYNQKIQKCEKCPYLCEDCISEYQCTKCISSKIDLLSGRCNCGRGYYYNKLSDSCQQCESQCKECQNFSYYCTECSDINMNKFNGKCDCFLDGEIKNDNGKCVCAPNYYKSSLNTCYQICQKILFIDLDNNINHKIGRLPKINIFSINNFAIGFNIYIDDNNCLIKSNQSIIQNIKFAIISADTNKELTREKINDKENMILKLNHENLNYLPFEKDLLLMVKFQLVAYQNDKNLNSAQTTETSDTINFTIIPSPIIIVLEGHNRGYGKSEIININASNSYDPDLEGANFYQPILFQWSCPIEIPIPECKSKQSFYSKDDAILFAASSLIQYGMRFNQYYEFEITVTRLQKQSKMKFWIQILEISIAPNIEINNYNLKIASFNSVFSPNLVTIVSDDFLLLRAKIISTISILSIDWYLESLNGMYIQASSNFKEEIQIQKEDLIKNQIQKIFVKAKLSTFSDEQGIVRKNMIIESFTLFSFKPPIISEDLEPTIKVTMVKSTNLYSVIDVEIVNMSSIESWIYPVLFTITANKKNKQGLDIDMNNQTQQKLYLIEDSTSSSIKNSVVYSDIESIQFKACTTIAKDCLKYAEQIDQFPPINKDNIEIDKIVTELFESSYFSMSIKCTKINAIIIILQQYQLSIEKTYNNKIFEDVLNKSLSLLDVNVYVPRAQSSLFIEIIKTSSMMLNDNSINTLINSQIDIAEVIKTLKESILNIIPKFFEGKYFCHIFGNYDIDHEIILNSINKLVSSVLRCGRTFGGNSTFYINLLETSMNIMISLEKCILKSNLFVKTYTQIYDETHSLIKPFYFVNYEMNSIIEENDCKGCIEMYNEIAVQNISRKYSINFYLENKRNDNNKHYVISNFLKNTQLSIFNNNLTDSSQENIGLNNIVMLVSVQVCSEEELSGCQKLNNVRISIPLVELNFNFYSEMPPTEYFNCFSYNRTIAGLSDYISSVIEQYQTNNTNDFKSLLWNSSSCKTLSNSTHLTCFCNSTNLVAIKFSYENMYTLKAFLLVVVFSIMISVYCCTLICSESLNERKHYSLEKIQTLVNYDLKSFWGVFCVLFSTLYVLTCCKRNPVMGHSKALLIFIIVTCALFNICLLLCQLLTSNQPHPTEYKEWSTNLSFVLVVILGSFFLWISYEFLKAMFIKSDYTGMVKFKDEGEHSKQKDVEIKEGQKIEEMKEIHQNVDQENVNKFVVSDCNQIIPTNPETLAKNIKTVASERNLKGENCKENEGVMGKYVVDVTKIAKEMDKRNEYNIGDEEIVLAADEFDESTKLNKRNVFIGVMAILCICVFPLLITVFSINKINIFAILISALLTIICISIYTSILQVLHIFLITSTVIYNKNMICGIIKKIFQTEESLMILLKVNKVQKAIEREKNIILQNKILQEANRAQNQLDFDQYFKNFSESKGSQFDVSNYNVDLLSGKINRKRHRHPNETNRVDSYLNLPHLFIIHRA